MAKQGVAALLALALSLLLLSPLAVARWPDSSARDPSLEALLNRFGGSVASSASHGRNAETEFVLGELKEVITGSGGAFSVWNKDAQLFQDTDIQAGILRLDPQGLLLPKYTDSHQMHYVVEGCARAGLVTPLGIPAGVRTLRQGDLLLHPRGWVLWIWNNGNDAMRTISVSDTSRSTEREGKGAPRAEQTSFHLAGSQEGENGGILHGFSEDVLSQAWDVEVDDVKSLMEGQKDSAIIKVEKSKVAALNSELDRLEREQTNAFIGDVVYNMEERERDFECPTAGWLAVMNGFKARLVRKIGMAAGRVHLEPNAITAPRWLANSAALYYAIRGQAHVEVVYPNGQPALRRDLKAGEAIVVPAGYARTSIAGDDGFDGVGFALETSRPYGGFLAGGNAVFRAIPRPIRRAAFNVGDDMLDKLSEARRDDYLIFPPRGQKGPDLKISMRAAADDWEMLEGEDGVTAGKETVALF